jgi:hypothetical protein
MEKIRLSSAMNSILTELTSQVFNDQDLEAKLMKTKKAKGTANIYPSCSKFSWDPGDNKAIPKEKDLAAAACHLSSHWE